MSDFVMPLPLVLDVSSLTMALVNIASPAGAVTPLADSVEAALRPLAHLDVERRGDTVVARSVAGHTQRVVVAGRLATGPVEDDPLAFVEMGKLFGPGSSDAKGAVAVMLKAAATGGFARDVTFVFGEVPFAEAEVSGADVVVLASPTDAAVVGASSDHPIVAGLIELSDAEPASASGAVADQLATFGAPAVAFGPGDPTLAGTPDEFVPTAQLTQCEFALRQWLTT